MSAVAIVQSRTPEVLRHFGRAGRQELPLHASETLERKTGPRGLCMAIGIPIGAGVGVALGIAFDSLATCIGASVAIGATFGYAMERR